MFLLALSPVESLAVLGLPGGDMKPPVLGDDDMAAILTPVLLAGLDSVAFSSFASVPSFFAGPCFFDLLFFDLEEEVVEVDLSSLVLLAASLFEAWLASWAALAARAFASAALGVFVVLAMVGDG